MVQYRLHSTRLLQAREQAERRRRSRLEHEQARRKSALLRNAGVEMTRCGEPQWLLFMLQAMVAYEEARRQAEDDVEKRRDAIRKNREVSFSRMAKY